MRYTQSICSSSITGIECIGWGGYAGFEYAYADGSFDNGIEVRKVYSNKQWKYEIQPEILLCL